MFNSNIITTPQDVTRSTLNIGLHAGIKAFSICLTVNTMRLYFKAQLVNAVRDKSLFVVKKAPKLIVWTKFRISLIL